MGKLIINTDGQERTRTLAALRALPLKPRFLGVARARLGVNVAVESEILVQKIQEFAGKLAPEDLNIIRMRERSVIQTLKNPYTITGFVNSMEGTSYMYNNKESFLNACGSLLGIQREFLEKRSKSDFYDLMVKNEYEIQTTLKFNMIESSLKADFEQQPYGNALGLDNTYFEELQEKASNEDQRIQLMTEKLIKELKTSAKLHKVIYAMDESLERNMKTFLKRESDDSSGSGGGNSGERDEESGGRRARDKEDGRGSGGEEEGGDDGRRGSYEKGGGHGGSYKQDDGGRGSFRGSGGGGQDGRGSDEEGALPSYRGGHREPVYRGEDPPRFQEVKRREQYRTPDPQHRKSEPRRSYHTFRSGSDGKPEYDNTVYCVRDGVKDEYDNLETIVREYNDYRNLEEDRERREGREEESSEEKRIYV